MLNQIQKIIYYKIGTAIVSLGVLCISVFTIQISNSIYFINIGAGLMLMVISMITLGLTMYELVLKGLNLEYRKKCVYLILTDFIIFFINLTTIIITMVCYIYSHKFKAVFIFLNTAFLFFLFPFFFYFLCNFFHFVFAKYSN